MVVDCPTSFPSLCDLFGVDPTAQCGYYTSYSVPLVTGGGVTLFLDPVWGVKCTDAVGTRDLF
jgi:hypothetical protein